MGYDQKAMVEQLITTAIYLLINDAKKTIHWICAILDFIILAQYLLYNNKTLSYIEYLLYRLDKTKILFEKYCSINTKIFYHHFNYLKFDAIIHFFKYINDYESVVHYDITHSEAAHEYLFKAFWV